MMQPRDYNIITKIIWIPTWYNKNWDASGSVTKKLNLKKGKKYYSLPLTCTNSYYSGGGNRH